MSPTRYYTLVCSEMPISLELYTIDLLYLSFLIAPYDDLSLNITLNISRYSDDLTPHISSLPVFCTSLLPAYLHSQREVRRNGRTFNETVLRREERELSSVIRGPTLRIADDSSFQGTGVSATQATKKGGQVEGLGKYHSFHTHECSRLLC